MLGLLFWIIGALAFAIEITSHHLWPQIAAAMLGAGFILWVFCGAFLISMRGKWPGAPRKVPVPSPETVARFRELQKQQPTAPKEAAK